MINYIQFLLDKKRNEGQILDDSTIDNIDIANIFDDVDNIPFWSGGILYPDGQESIKIRKLNFLDENILSKENLYANNEVWKILINNVIHKDEILTYDDLLPMDVDGILLWLRMTAFGSEYRLDINCPRCKSNKSQIVWDLKQTAFKGIEDDKNELLKEYGAIPYKYNDEITIGITIPTMSKIAEVDKFIKKLETAEGMDFTSTKELLYVLSHIEEQIEGENIILTDIKDIYIKLLTISLSLKKTNDIKKLAMEINHSLILKTTFKCKDNLKDDEGKLLTNTEGEFVKCNYKEDGIDLIMGRSFFLQNIQ